MATTRTLLAAAVAISAVAAPVLASAEPAFPRRTVTIHKHMRGGPYGFVRPERCIVRHDRFWNGRAWVDRRVRECR
ncbi:MAG: hypothetical protein J2P54_26315 [Bradyrhizobiaceae bacterium]|nr:hypothetical protein [Bradyrhizobiaceae bacterium]